MSSHWDQHAASFREDLKRHAGTDTLRALHRKRPLRHALVALRQVLLLGGAATAIVLRPDTPWIWIPASVVIGFVLFSFSILLHEVLHGMVFERRRPRVERILGLLYAIPSGLSASQFTRWHLDHHDGLGTTTQDPKRAHLSPKRNARWLKALYFTPALFPIYFRAAKQGTSSYPAPLRARIAKERAATVLVHLGVLLGLGFGAGWDLAVKLHALPVFVVFPVAFAINRLGQHYDVDPEDPARWGTLMAPSPFLWDPIYLWSNYHLEHHYFPKVPCYHLPALRRALQGFFDERGIPSRTYGGLLCDWLLRNRPPHADWGMGRSTSTGTSTAPAQGA